MSTPKSTTTIAPPAVDTSAWQSAGRNVKFHTLDGLLFIAIPINDAAISSAPASASGKSKSVGSTLGNVAIPGTPLKFGVNVYTPSAA